MVSGVWSVGFGLCGVVGGGCSMWCFRWDVVGEGWPVEGRRGRVRWGFVSGAWSAGHARLGVVDEVW